MDKKNLIRTVLLAELLLLVPLAGMQISEDWNWSLSDFIIASVLLAGFGVGCNLVLSGLKNNRRRTIVGALLVLVMLVLWVEMAVGLFGSPIAGS